MSALDDLGLPAAAPQEALGLLLPVGAAHAREVVASTELELERAALVEEWAAPLAASPPPPQLAPHPPRPQLPP